MPASRRVVSGLALAALAAGLLQLPAPGAATAGLGERPSSAASGNRGERLESWRSRLDAAEIAGREGRFREAESLYREVAAESRSWKRPNLILARAVDGLADLRLSERRYAEAVSLYDRSAEMWRALLGPRQPRLATTLHNLGVALAAAGEPDNARRRLEQALAIWESSLGDDSAEARNTRSALARIRGRGEP